MNKGSFKLKRFKDRVNQLQAKLAEAMLGLTASKVVRLIGLLLVFAGTH